MSESNSIYKNVVSEFYPSERKQESGEYKFYNFSQNNSGGSFEVDKNVCENVIIAATSPEDANARAEEVGIYFDGALDDGPDCSCCGDRWSRQYGAAEASETPKIWGQSVEEYLSDKNTLFRNKVIIYYPDGSKQILSKKKQNE
jgi:hypothetical protein